MARVPLIYVVATTLAAAAAVAQNAAQPGSSTRTNPPAQTQNPAPTQSPAPIQSRPEAVDPQSAHPPKSANGALRRHGPSFGNQVQAPSPDQAKGTRSASAGQSATDTRPDAKHPYSSGQDSQPDKTSVAAPGPGQDKQPGHDRTRGATGQSNPATQPEKRKTYAQSSGSKAEDPSHRAQDRSRGSKNRGRGSEDPSRGSGDRGPRPEEQSHP
jgi:hypothetical protein